MPRRLHKTGFDLDFRRNRPWRQRRSIGHAKGCRRPEPLQLRLHKRQKRPLGRSQLPSRKLLFVIIKGPFELNRQLSQLNASPRLPQLSFFGGTSSGADRHFS